MIKKIRGFQVVLPPLRRFLVQTKGGKTTIFCLRKKARKNRRLRRALSNHIPSEYCYYCTCNDNVQTQYLLMPFRLLQSNKFFHDEDLRVNLVSEN